jgi:hypothetical protein
MTASKIMVIRHAEKPDDASTVFGVTIQGIQDPEELIVRVITVWATHKSSSLLGSCALSLLSF